MNHWMIVYDTIMASNVANFVKMFSENGALSAPKIICG